MRAKECPDAEERRGSAVRVNECLVFSTQRGVDWWTTFRAAYEITGRVRVVKQSLAGDLCEVECTDDAEARWWAGWAEQGGVPASALKVFRAGAR